MITPKSKNRPFGQGIYDKKSLVPIWKDFHYKFTLFLPLTEHTLGSSWPEKQVFRKEDLDNLNKLFLEDFDGVTYAKENPSKVGQWPKGRTRRTIVNEHAIFEIYSQRTREALNYFDELKERLEIRAKELGAKQDIIVIDQSEVTFATKPSFNKNFLKHLLRNTK